jgi:NAD(P)-dependent dehydrogenase (short-subunit alcohol dehydrogenase family)
MAQQDDNWLGLHGRICVVTGAGGGIGRAVALGMAKAGASVVLLDNNVDNCRATADALRPTGASTLALECDIADPESIAAAERAAQVFGPCDAQGFAGAYSVSKAGVLMLSRQLAVEWGPHGVRSNVVSPGLVRTPMSESFYQDPDVLRRREAAIPLGRIGSPDDMAQVVLFLASDRAGFVTGQEIIVDGGFEHMLMSLVPRPGFERGN